MDQERMEGEPLHHTKEAVAEEIHSQVQGEGEEEDNCKGQAPDKSIVTSGRREEEGRPACSYTQLQQEMPSQRSTQQAARSDEGRECLLTLLLPQRPLSDSA